MHYKISLTAVWHRYKFIYHHNAVLNISDHIHVVFSEIKLGYKHRHALLPPNPILQFPHVTYMLILKYCLSYGILNALFRIDKQFTKKACCLNLRWKNYDYSATVGVTVQQVWLIAKNVGVAMHQHLKSCRSPPSTIVTIQWKVIFYL